MMDKNALVEAASHVKIALTAAIEGTLDVGPLIDVDETARKTAQAVIGGYLSAITVDGGELVSRLQKREREARDIMHQSIFADELRDYIDRLIALEAKCAEMAKLVYVPGEWHCPKCKFTLLQRNLNTANGTVTARDTPGDKCPNCATTLWRVSWKDSAQQNMDIAEAQWQRAVLSESDLAIERERVKRGEEALRKMQARDDELGSLPPAYRAIIDAAFAPKEPANGG